MTSFVSAADNITDEVGDETILSVSDDIAVDENDEQDSVEKSSGSLLGLANDDQSDENKSEKNLVKNDAQVLGVSNDEPVLGATAPADITTVTEIVKWIARQTDVNIFLGNRTYTGGAEWGGFFNGVSNKHIYGGNSIGDGKTSSFTGGGIVFMSLSGNCDNLVFDGLRADNRLFWFSGTGGSLTNTVINNCECREQFIWLGGWKQNSLFYVTNCNFTNSRQTYGLENPDSPEGDYYDGHGQFGAVAGIKMENCNFINVTSGHHGGALCIADESENGATFGGHGIASEIINTNFINITSRWFAVYMHGDFRTTPAEYYLKDPQIIQNCKFINCSGTYEYSGGLGISHNNVQVKDCEFINCDGGQGSAIMVGGLDGDHDGFNGRNYQANNVLIENCNFTNNIATTVGKKTSQFSGWFELGWGETRDTSRYTYYIEPNGRIDNVRGTWYFKHDASSYSPSGDAGAIYVIGNDTHIKNCIFRENKADGEGAAIYIYGQRTIVEGSKFYNHTCDNGTIFIEGNNVTIKDSTFEDNYAEIGSAIYILGSRTEINHSTFENNNGTNGTVYIKGNNTKIISGSNFADNNASYGGGIYIAGANTLISGSNFDRNNATHDGGGMYIKGDNTQITSRSNFTENHAVNGGGIYLGGTNTSISASNFVRNNATYDGAGMYVKGNNTKAIDGSNFTENSAAHDGAGMYIEGMNTLISNTYFEKNNATNGGGLYIKGNKTNITSGSDFMENTATYGAGAFLEGSNTLINGSKFEKNNATGGAGIFITGNNTKITSGSNFTENNATYGAGIYIKGSDTVISGSNFEKNNATNGAGMFISGNRTNITSGSDFIENTAVNGAGMYVDGSYTLVSGSRFEKNNATENGAGMFISGDRTNITSGSDFIENTAVKGAGIYVEGSKTNIEGSLFKNNDATDGAGGYIDGSETVISGSTFEINNATDGAGIYVIGVGTEIIKSTFTNNTAERGAGGFVDGKDTKILNSTFKLNNATDGAGFYITGNNTQVNASTFTDNDAVKGAGGYIDGKDTRISNSTFKFNNATDGAGFYISGNNTMINSSTFTDNDAVNGAGGYVDGRDTKIFNSTFEINNATNGAGIYVSGSNTTINGSTFTNNSATDGAGGYVDGSDTTILDSRFEINNATNGAGIYVKGTETKILNTTFYNNTATDGAGGYVNGSNTNISSDSLFKYNKAVNGAGIYVNGASTEILNTTFDNNTAVNGGGAYIKGSDTNILNSTFIKNNVTYHGGAVYIDGSRSKIKNNNFTYNEAVPDNNKSELSGLGGAIFVKGDDTYTFGNDFEHNKARNGSAIYSSGTNFRLENDIFRENQAWSYILITIAEPVVSYVNTHDVKIEVVHIGGDNMINAIHSNASFDQISLKNVTYVHSSGDTYSTSETEFQKPVDGVENSDNGKLLYQDDREYLQNITIAVKYVSESIADSPRLRRAAVGDVIYYNDTLKTHLYGDIYVTLEKEKLQVGKYLVTAAHPEDWNYKGISNYAEFWILPYVDLSVNKTSDKYEYFDDDIAVWTIKVSNAANASNATNVVIDDLLPSDFKFINASATLGSYDNHTGLWTIDNLENGTNATLTIYSRAEANIERLNHFVNIDSNEDKVKLVVTRESDKTSYEENDNARWTLTVTNEGGATAHNVNITHIIPFEFEYNSTIRQDGGDFSIEVHTGHAMLETGQWLIDSIESGQSLTLIIKTIATYDDSEITDYINVDYKEKHLNLTVNKTSDKEEYIAGQTAIITIKINNTHGCNATGVVLNDVLQPEFEFNRVISISQGTYDNATNVWTVGDMNENSEVTLVLETHTIVVYGVVTNYAIASSDESDWNESNNIANASVEVVPLPQPSKSVSNITPDYHGFIEYNLTIYNTGNTTYRNNLTVTDTLPVTLDFVEFIKVIGADIVPQTNSSGASVNYTVDGQKVKWILTNIENKTSAIIHIKLQVNGLGKMITNTSVINSIHNLANNDQLFDKLVELTNNATFMRQLMDQTGNSIFIRSIANLTKTGATFNKLIELVNNNTYVEAIGALTNDTFKQELLDLTGNSVGINSTGNLTNYLTVTGPNGTNVTDSCSVYPTPLVDVSVNITSDKDEYFVDDIAFWTIVVSNAGNGTNATNVTLKDLFPSDYFDIINCTVPTGTEFNETTGVWTIGNLTNGTNVTLVIKSIAKRDGKDIPHNVSVSCNETEWNITNNKANKLVDVIVLPYPVKTVNNITPNYHDFIEYNLTIVNNGTTKYTNILNVTDSLPDGLEFNGTVRVIGADVVVQTGAGVVSEMIDGKMVYYLVEGQKVTWRITNITGNSNATIVIRVKVNALGVEITDSEIIGAIVGSDSRVINRLGNLTNNVTVTGPNGTVQFDNCTVYPVPVVDVSVNITSDKDEYFVDDIAVWTITVSNAPNGTNATNVTLKDLFPSDLFEFINCTLPDGSNFTGDVWYIGDLANGTNVTFTVYSRAIANGTVDHNVSVSCNETDWNMSNNEDNKTVVVVPLPHPVKTVNNITPYYHDEIMYNLTIVNTGTTVYTNQLTIIDSLPDGLAFEGFILNEIGTFKGFEENNNEYKWIFSNIPVGSNAVVTVRVKVNALGNLTNNLTLIGPNGTVKMDNETVYPVPIVDVSVNITSDKDEYFVDDIAVWTVVVSNAGNGTNATDINLKDLFPSDYFEFINCTDEFGNEYNLTDDWIIPFMGNGTNVTFTIYSQAVTPENNINNTVEVNCTEDEWDYANNDATKVVGIVPLPYPVKSVNNNTPYYHDIIEYTLTVVNVGSSNYMDNLTVIDSLPVGLEFIETVSVTGAVKLSEVQGNHNVTWILTNISTNNATITVRVKVNSLGDQTNNLTIVGPKDTTVTVNETVYPVPIVDLSVNITSDKVEYFVDDVAVWTITVSNAANGTNASNIKLSELLPEEFEFMYSSDDVAYDNVTGVWSIPSLANGTNITLVIYSHAKVPASDINNKVNVSCDEDEWDYTNNMDDITVEIVAFHKPVKTVSNSTPYYHEYVNYTMTVENLGNYTYTSEFDAIDSLPDGLEFVRTLSITGADLIKETHEGQVVTWALTNIPAKSNATIVILVKVNAIGNLTNNLTVVGPRNSSDMVNCTIDPIPIVDISVEITSDKDEYFVDDVAVWTITVSNAGNGTNASDIKLSELIPEEFEYMYCDAPNGTAYDNGTGVWTVPNLANGTNITLVIYSHAKVPASDITNEVNVTCAEKEWDESNNDANVTVEIVAFHKPVKTVS
ncbi:right-handed parallel beta-helix repeat-containing protein, partial [Methanobrevibacter sp.]